MPTLEDMDYARPLCRRRRIITQGQHGVHVTCLQPMTYTIGENLWWCTACSAPTEGYEVAAQAQRIMAAAA